MKDLKEIRAEIDSVDKELVELYEKRMALTEQVADYKLSTGKKVFDKAREEEKLEKVTSMVDDPFLKRGTRELFEHLMSMSRKRQYQKLAEKGIMEPIPFEEVAVLPDKNIRIVYQGEEGAYSQMAMQQFFHDTTNSYHVQTWRDAMEAIAKGEADYAVLPIENSSAGIVSENYDLLVEYDNCIVGEQIIPIDHCLLGTKGSKLSDIEQVYSHPQALMQSEGYLYQHKDWQQISVSNTAASAKKILEDGNVSEAAIASRRAAAIYGLKVLKESIQDNDLNTTRFVIVGKDKIYAKDASKISICFEIAHESGSLYEMLSHFIFNNLNMTKIESRPIESRNWEYRFFIDFTGKLGDAAVKNALRGIDEEACSFKILGNY